jgi:DNA sulfur modification protein DndB
VIENSHAFAAIRGIQAGREYYVTMLPLKVISKLFQFDEPDLPPELRAQRSLNKTRIPEIARYLSENRRAYTLASLTASVDGKVRFEPLGETDAAKAVGRLMIPMSARLVINDGQHRRAAIEAALKETPELAEETISVIFFIDAGLRRSQQMFADLNRHVVRPPQSLNVLYDGRDKLAQLTCRVVEKVRVFRTLTETERGSIPLRSNKLFTLSGLYRATANLLGRPARGRISGTDEDKASEYWNSVSEQIPDWHLAADKRVTCAELRRDYMHSHGVTLEALGIAGAKLLAVAGSKWKEAVKGLRDVDWARSNTAVWEGTAMVDGRVSKAHVHVTRTARMLSRAFGIVEEVATTSGNRGAAARRRR